MGRPSLNLIGEQLNSRRPLILVHLQRRDKCLLRDFDLAELPHLLLAFLLFVEKLALEENF
jgi:hypothetical protein